MAKAAAKDGPRSKIKVGLIISVAYIVSFALPAMLKHGDWLLQYSGLQVFVDLLYERMYPCFGITAVAINLLFCVGVYCLFRKLWSVTVFIGFISALSAVVVAWLGMDTLPPHTDLTLGPGYYLWVTSMVALVMAALFRMS